MKFSIIFLASFTSATDFDDTAFSTLLNLENISEEIIYSESINERPAWKTRWKNKFQTNTSRMMKSFERCGTTNVEGEDEIEIEYDTSNPCRAIDELINGYSKWVDRYIADCKGQKNHSHQKKRFEKWNNKLDKGKVQSNFSRPLIFLVHYFIRGRFEPIKVLECDEKYKNLKIPYTFVVPEDNWEISKHVSENRYSMERLKRGQSLTYSKLCNPNFMISGVASCEIIANWNFCKASVKGIVLFSYKATENSNTNDTLETALQCPRSERFPCGCGPEGAADLNDLYAAEAAGLRKISAGANIMLPHMNNIQ